MVKESLRLILKFNEMEVKLGSIGGGRVSGKGAGRNRRGGVNLLALYCDQDCGILCNELIF